MQTPRLLLQLSLPAHPDIKVQFHLFETEGMGIQVVFFKAPAEWISPLLIRGIWHLQLYREKNPPLLPVHTDSTIELWAIENSPLTAAIYQDIQRADEEPPGALHHFYLRYGDTILEMVAETYAQEPSWVQAYDVNMPHPHGLPAAHQSVGLVNVLPAWRLPSQIPLQAVFLPDEATFLCMLRPVTLAPPYDEMKRSLRFGRITALRMRTWAQAYLYDTRLEALPEGIVFEDRMPNQAPLAQYYLLAEGYCWISIASDRIQVSDVV